MKVRHYVLRNSRWVRVNRCGSNTFTFKGDNVVYSFDDYEYRRKTL